MVHPAVRISLYHASTESGSILDQFVHLPHCSCTHGPIECSTFKAAHRVSSRWFRDGRLGNGHLTEHSPHMFESSLDHTSIPYQSRSLVSRTLFLLQQSFLVPDRLLLCFPQQIELNIVYENSNKFHGEAIH